MNIYLDDRVAYSIHYLRSIGCSLTDELYHVRGVLLSVKNLGELQIGTVQWEDDATRTNVNIQNLAHVGLNQNYSNCGVPACKVMFKNGKRPEPELPINDSWELWQKDRYKAIIKTLEYFGLAPEPEKPEPKKKKRYGKKNWYPQ